MDNPEHFGGNNSCMSREAGHLMGSALHSCVQLEQYLACLPCREAICCCGDAGMSLLFQQECTQSHKEKIRMTLWPDQAKQLLSSISAVENRAHSWGCGHCFLWKSPSHPCSMPMLPVPWQEALSQSKGQQVTPLALLTWQESSRPSPASSEEEAGSRYWYQLAA